VNAAGALAHRERLPAASKLGLAAEIIVAYARARRALRRQSLPAAAAAMRRVSGHARRACDDAYGTGLRLGRVVTRVLGVLPRDPRCLTTSLVLTALLARRGIPATLVIGVRPDPFAAHAWVEHRGRPLLPPATAPFERLVEV
jgi:transglutaminase-like putative cysteine protease